MTIKALECDHVTIHLDGSSTSVRLAAYKKGGAYQVTKAGNTISEQTPLDTLEKVLPFIGKGYRVRMRSELMLVQGKRRRIHGFYGSSQIEVIR